PNDTLHAKPDLVGYQIGRWQPTNVANDLYIGSWSATGQFVRVDIGFSGLINPPGPVGITSPAYAPYLYGPNPVLGFIEFDLDHDTSTGGETSAPGLRYLANVARFGGKPATPRFADRVALQASDADLPFDTAPYVKRSGEEFHIALFGDHITQ